MNKVDIGRRIAKKREEAGFRQGDFGREIGVDSPTAQWKYENGLAVPKLDRLIEMAHKVDVLLDYLITGKTKELPAHESYPLYPKSWESWKKTAPADLNEEESKWLMSAPFPTEPEPFRYKILLEQLRALRKS